MGNLYPEVRSIMLICVGVCVCPKSKQANTLLKGSKYHQHLSTVLGGTLTLRAGTLIWGEKNNRLVKLLLKSDRICWISVEGAGWSQLAVPPCTLCLFGEVRIAT